MVTRYGVESGVFYAVGATLRDTIERDGHAVVHVDLHPDRGESDVGRLLATRRHGDSTSEWLRRRLALTPVAIGLLREVTGNRLPNEPAAMAALVKAAPLRLVGVQPLARAISTAGGVALDAIDDYIDAGRPTGRVRRRGDARLGGPDRRLSAPGLLQHRARRWNERLRWLRRNDEHRADSTDGTGPIEPRTVSVQATNHAGPARTRRTGTVEPRRS